MSAAERNSWMSPMREGGGEAGLVEVLLEESSVSGAEAGVWVRDGQTAKAAPRGRAVLAMERGGIGDGSGPEKDNAEALRARGQRRGEY